MITDPFFYLVAIPATLLLGISKSGFGAGFGSLAVPLMAMAVPVPQAAAIFMPLLLVMDLLGLHHATGGRHDGRAHFGREIQPGVQRGAAGEQGDAAMAELRDWLRRLHDDVHVTTVFVTHDQEEALEVADEIVVINEGRVEQTGSADELYEHPANEFVMSFVGEVNRLGDHFVRPHDMEVVLDADDRYLIVNPYFHTFGYKAGWLACILAGATNLPEAVFDAGRVLGRVERVFLTHSPRIDKVVFAATKAQVAEEAEHICKHLEGFEVVKVTPAGVADIRPGDNLAGEN